MRPAAAAWPTTGPLVSVVRSADRPSITTTTSGP